MLTDKPRDLDLRFRITLDLERIPGDIYLAVEPLVIPPPEAYKAGVRVITCDCSASSQKPSSRVSFSAQPRCAAIYRPT